MPDDIYVHMMENYKTERDGLTVKRDSLKTVIAEVEKDSGNIEEFTELIGKYLHIS